MRIWIFVRAVTPDAAVKASVVNAFNTTSKANNCLVAVSRMMWKKPTTVVSGHSPRRGIYKYPSNHIYCEAVKSATAQKRLVCWFWCKKVFTATESSVNPPRYHHQLRQCNHPRAEHQPPSPLPKQMEHFQNYDGPRSTEQLSLYRGSHL
jgi:hypothetical protein